MRLFWGLELAGLIALLIYLIVVCFATHPNLGAVGYDSEVFRYIGMIINQGGMPYLDAFDHKPPLIYLVAALGHFFGRQGFWFLEVFVTGISVITLAYFGKREKWPLWYLFPFGFISMVRYPEFLFSGCLTRSFSAAFILLGILQIFSKFKWRFAVFGALIATVFLFQQNDAPALVVIFAIMLGAEFKVNNVFVKLLESFCGFVIIALPIFLWLYYKGAWSEFIVQAFGFNSDGSHKNIFQVFRFTKDTLSMHHFKPWNLGVFGILILLYPKILPDRFRVIALLLVGFLAQVMLSRIKPFYFPHYFLSYTPWLIVLTGEICKEFGIQFSNVLPFRFIALVVIGLLMVLPGNSMGRNWHLGISAIKKIREGSIPFYDTRLNSYLEPFRGKKGQLLVYDNASMLSINSEFNIPAPSKWNHMMFWRASDLKVWDPELKKYHEFLDDIEKYQTKYILDCEDPEFTDPIKSIWAEYLKLHYNYIDRIGCGRLMVRK